MELNSAQVNIRDLVAQVKSGQINKKDAFKELHSILKTTGGDDTAAVDSVEETSVAADAEEDMTNSNGGRISQEDRRLLINKLIEQKQRARAEAEDEVNSVHDGSTNHFDDEAEVEGEEYFTGQSWVGRNPTSSQSQSQRPRSATSGRSSGNAAANEMNDYSYFTRGSADDSGIGRDSRSNRIAQTEAAIRHDMFKDCTFRPQIKALPASYGAQKEADTDFYGRVTRWQKDKSAAATRRRSIQDMSDVSNCTFQPKINRNSLRAVQEIRGDVNEDPADRLYKNHELSILQRSKYIEEELARERSLETEQCTFNPNVTASNTSKFSQVRCKVSANPKKHSQSATDNHEQKNCTFQPVVKGVGNHMRSAQVYVSTNVVDRLTKPLVQAEPEASSETKLGDGPVYDMASFMGALNQSGATTASVRGKDLTVDTSISFRSKGKDIDQSTAEKQLDKKTLQIFLGRQEQSALRREQKLKANTETGEPSFEPRLYKNKKYTELSDKNSKGAFLERVERDVLRRADHEIRAAVIPDESCTFQPSITHKSEKLRPRTVYEMSRGDQLKRVTANRMMRMRSDQEELQEMTFKPEITKKAHNSNSQKVSLAKDTSKFLEMQKEKSQRREADRLAILEQREKDELDKCTFAPATKDCPSYVRRIAKSMAVVRNARSQAEKEPAESKPTWK